jgi:hypothetical protein
MGYEAFFSMRDKTGRQRYALEKFLRTEMGQKGEGRSLHQPKKLKTAQRTV